MALIANNERINLLKIIAGTDIADDGSVTIRSGIGYSSGADFNQSLSIEDLSIRLIQML